MDNHSTETDVILGAFRGVTASLKQPWRQVAFCSRIRVHSGIYAHVPGRARTGCAKQEAAGGPLALGSVLPGSPSGDTATPPRLLTRATSWAREWQRWLRAWADVPSPLSVPGLNALAWIGPGCPEAALLLQELGTHSLAFSTIASFLMLSYVVSGPPDLLLKDKLWAWLFRAFLLDLKREVGGGQKKKGKEKKNRFGLF